MDLLILSCFLLRLFIFEAGIIAANTPRFGGRKRAVRSGGEQDVVDRNQRNQVLVLKNGKGKNKNPFILLSFALIGFIVTFSFSASCRRPLR